MSTHPTAALTPGMPAPECRLPSTPDQFVTLSEFRGRPVILAFYPADWSPVCGDQMTLYNEVLPEFHRFHAALLGISVEGAWCHLSFAKEPQPFHQLGERDSQRLSDGLDVPQGDVPLTPFDPSSYGIRFSGGCLHLPESASSFGQ